LAIIGGIQVNESSIKPRISSVTRRKLTKVFSQYHWWGNLEEIEFLNRLYKLDELAASDSRHENAQGDVFQHRIGNDDWPDEWIFTDERFGLGLGKADAPLLRFLAESLHPEVRTDPEEVGQLVRILNELLRRDGWTLTQHAQISGFPVYGFEACDPATQDIPELFPIDLSAMVAALADVLKNRGQARELAVIASSNISVTQSGFDNWNGGTRGWTITFRLEPSLFARFATDERTETETTLNSTLEEFFRPFENDALYGVLVVPNAITRTDWREAAQHWLSGQGITNQGRVRSSNLASLECDGLLFRSEPEILFYRALKASGVTFAPLAVFLRGGESYSRFEPDFLIIKDGGVLVVEIDGDTYHRESPADADSRLRPLKHEGAYIERVKASECSSEVTAKASVQRVLGALEKFNRNRR
jgi:hypothetical protein